MVLMAVAVAVGCAAAEPDGWSVKRQAAVDRPRTLVYNTDGCDVLYWPTNMSVSVEAFKNRRLKYALDSRITTVSYCPQSAGFNHFTCRRAGEPLLGSVTSTFHGLDNAFNACGKFFELGTDSLEMASDFCRSNNLEVFVSIRMNDQHDSVSSPEKGYSALFPEWKKTHPECLMGKFGPRNANTNIYPDARCNWSCVNFAMPAVRERVKEFVRQFLENYDVDGIEFDFNRHCVLFKSVMEGGVASDGERALMTGLMRDLRAIAEDVGRRKNHPFVLVMRAPDSAAYCRDVGIDLETWFKEKSVDIWIGGGYFRLTPWEESVKLAHRHGVKFYASIDESRIERTCRKSKQKLPCIRGRETRAAYAACFANAMAAGADGCYLFNREEKFLHELAQMDPAHLAAEDKLYFVRYRGSGGYRPDNWLFDGYRHDRLPQLDPGMQWKKDTKRYQGGETAKFTLAISDDFAKVKSAVPSVTAIALTDLSRGTKLDLSVNGKPYQAAADDLGFVRFKVAPADLWLGNNAFEVIFPMGATDVRFADFALDVRYSGGEVKGR